MLSGLKCTFSFYLESHLSCISCLLLLSASSALLGEVHLALASQLLSPLIKTLVNANWRCASCLNLPICNSESFDD